MNKTYKFPALWMMCLMLFSCLTFTACDNGDDEDTNQYKGGISLNVFGPSPVSRGGVLRFLGSGMDKVTAVAIPGCDDITDIEVVSDTEIRVTVPQTAQPGLVVLKTPKGDITTKTELTFTEPIALEAFAPAEVKPGGELTITGEYLNLIKEVIFADEVTVPADEFVSQSRQEIKVIVPDRIKIAVPNAAAAAHAFVVVDVRLAVFDDGHTDVRVKVGQHVQIQPGSIALHLEDVLAAILALVAACILDQCHAGGAVARNAQQVHQADSGACLDVVDHDATLDLVNVQHISFPP